MEPKHYVIKVTEEEIVESQKGHAGKCMVANAIRKSIPGAESIDVTPDTVRFNLFDSNSGKTYRYIYDTVGRAGVEILNFDDDKEVKPFRFKLDARQAFTKEVKRRGPREVTKKRSKNKNPVSPCERKARRTVVRRRHGLKINVNDD